MNVADIHARWRQKMSSDTQAEKSDRAQRLWAAAGAFAGIPLGGIAGAPLGASTVPAPPEEMIREWDDLRSEIRLNERRWQGTGSSHSLLQKRKEKAMQELAANKARFQELDNVVEPYYRKVNQRAGVGGMIGASVGALAGYYALKHLARPSE